MAHYSITQQIIDKVESLGYQYRISLSQTSFGCSEYLFVSNGNNEVKVRISDHSVTSINRIFDEIHIDFRSVNFQSVINCVNFHLNRDSFYESVESIEKYTSYDVQVFEGKLRESDVITKTFTTKKGDTMHLVNRTYNNKVINWIFKGTDIIYKSERF